jgi:hypothetical protein
MRLEEYTADAICLGLKYPLQEVPPEKPITRLAVLGTPEERSLYFEMLQQAKNGEHLSAPKEQQQTSPGQRPGLTNQNNDEP